MECCLLCVWLRHKFPALHTAGHGDTQLLIPPPRRQKREDENFMVILG